MNLESYFRSISYALIGAAFAGLALTGELDALSVGLFLLAFAVSFYADSRGWTRMRLSERMWRTLAIAYIPFSFVDAWVFSDRIIALTHLTMFVSAAKLLQNKRDRDWVFLYVVAFFQVLLTAGLTFNAMFVVSLTVFLFCFISTLTAFEIRRARREVTTINSEEEIILSPKKSRRKDERKDAGAKRTRYLIIASLAQIAVVGALALPLFFMIPRFGSGNIGRGFGEGDMRTGFSERVQLGDVASIKKSQRVVMRIGLDRQTQQWIRWRGVVLDKYDGNNSGWESSREGEQGADQGFVSGTSDADESSKFVRVYPLSEAPADNRFMLEQKIALEPLGTNALFAARRPVVLKGPFSPIRRDKYTDAISTQSLGARVLYTVKSDISVPDEQELSSDKVTEYPEYIQRLYLQLPAIDPRIRQMANKIVNDADARTPYDKARAIESHLKTKFSYTLDLKPAKKDPLAEFLFDLREGHCEYFATSLAVLLRSIGIPARVVNGFQMGEFNQISGLYTVRDSDAHSWVEVYFAEKRVWVEFDATPSDGINDYSQGGLLAKLRQYMDALEVFWLDYVVTLDSDEQASMMAEIQKRLLKFRDGAYGYYKAVKEWFRGAVIKFLLERKWDAASIFKLILVTVFLGVAIMAAYIAVAHRKRKRLAPTGYGPWWHRWLIVPLWRRKLRSTDHQQSAVLFYEQMLAIASRARLIKQPDQTPVEFAEASGFDEIREITRAYNRVRFGGARLDAEEARRVSQSLADLKRTVRKRKSRRARNRP
ncbi:MAG: DUF3488 and transglutaminase-like domain-containing protein [Acidobacteriota bacterium]